MAALPIDQRTIARWFNIAAFTAPGPQQFGNTGRNILRGPGTAQADLSLFKDFPVHEERAGGCNCAPNLSMSATRRSSTIRTVHRHGAGGDHHRAGTPFLFQRPSREIQLALKLYF